MVPMTLADAGRPTNQLPIASQNNPTVVLAYDGQAPAEIDRLVLENNVSRLKQLASKHQLKFRPVGSRVYFWPSKYSDPEPFKKAAKQWKLVIEALGEGWTNIGKLSKESAEWSNVFTKARLSEWAKESNLFSDSASVRLNWLYEIHLRTADRFWIIHLSQESLASNSLNPLMAVDGFLLAEAKPNGSLLQVFLSPTAKGTQIRKIVVTDFIAFLCEELETARKPLTDAYADRTSQQAKNLNDRLGKNADGLYHPVTEYPTWFVELCLQELIRATTEKAGSSNVKIRVAGCVPVVEIRPDLPGGAPVSVRLETLTSLE